MVRYTDEERNENFDDQPEYVLVSYEEYLNLVNRLETVLPINEEMKKLMGLLESLAEE